MIRDLRAASDADALARIYNHYVLHDTATFETEPVEPAEMRSRAEDVLARGLPYLVLEIDDAVVGYAYARPFHARAAYAHTVEAAIYLDHRLLRGGHGRALYEALLTRLRSLDAGPHAPIHTVLGIVALPHPGSATLHERLGFRHVGTILEAGYKFDRWIDVGQWQLQL